MPDATGPPLQIENLVTEVVMPTLQDGSKGMDVKEDRLL
jgi:hypothetical protein